MPEVQGLNTASRLCCLSPIRRRPASKGKASVIETNLRDPAQTEPLTTEFSLQMTGMMKVMSHGFSKRSWRPSAVPDMVKATLTGTRKHRPDVFGTTLV